MKYLLPTLALALAFCRFNADLNPAKNLDYCVEQASRTLAQLPREDTLLPRSIKAGETNWSLVKAGDWTSGFWPGILWYLYEYMGDNKWKTEADHYSRILTPLASRPASDHDLGFRMYCSFGNGYRLTGDTAYKAILLRTADTLATLFNPRVGTILSWPGMKQAKGWPHNTIIDNMMNLELLFWASKNGGSQALYDLAVRHAETTMKNHFRPDYSAYHVVIYNDTTGERIKGLTHQGYSDKSMWARGQAWGIYGYTMTYRETRKPEFLDFARKITGVFLKRLPADWIPYWDFDAPNIPHEPKDAAAAAITASALLELAGYVPDQNLAAEYRSRAEKILSVLSSAQYQSREKNSAFLLHSTGHKLAGGEVDASIIYADYYYLEALMRLKKWREKR